MARVETDPNYSSPTFSRATAGTDLFKKEDVQALAAAVSTHDHSTGKGVALTAGAIPNGTITSAMIADGTIVAGDIADGAVTSAKILDGTIQAVDHADASVTNAKLAADTARANLLTNGGFEIWQRGAGPFTNSGFSADRWEITRAGSDTLQIIRDAAAADTALGSAADAQCAFTLSGGAGGTSINQRLADGNQILNRTLTLSVRVRVSTASAVRAALHNGSTWVYSSYHTGGGAYETLTVSTTVTTASSYAAVAFSASCTANVDNAMLVTGAVPADYAPLHPADDLARCQRYYETFNFTSGYGVGMIQGMGTTSLAGGTSLRLMTKPATPSITNSGAWNVAVGNGSVIVVTPAFAATLNQIAFAATGTVVNGTTYWLVPPSGATIVAESNP